jgi:hypothetical protein
MAEDRRAFDPFAPPPAQLADLREQKASPVAREPSQAEPTPAADTDEIENAAGQGSKAGRSPKSRKPRLLR